MGIKHCVDSTPLQHSLDGPVVKAFAPRYHLLGIVVKAFAPRYRLLGLVVKAFAPRYLLLGLVVKAFAPRYRLLGPVVKGATLVPRKQTSAGQGLVNISVTTDTGESWEGRCAGVSRSVK